MSCCDITASSVPRRPRRPPCTFGCSVLTRPSMISGKPVSVDTSVTGTPAWRSAAAVPPVETSAMPSASRPCAKSTRPVLSETLSSARRTGTRVASNMEGPQAETADYTDAGGSRRHRRPMSSEREKRPGAGAGPADSFSRRRRTCLVGEAVLMQLLAQRRAIDAERGRGLALVAAVPGHHFAEQRRFDFVQHERVQAFARLRFDVGEIAAHRARDILAQRRLQLRFVRGFGAQDTDG